MFFTTNELISLHRGAQGHGLSVQTKRIIFVVLLMHSCRGVAKAQTTNEPVSTKAVVLLRTRIIFIRLIQQLQSRMNHRLQTNQCPPQQTPSFIAEGLNYKSASVHDDVIREREETTNHPYYSLSTAKEKKFNISQKRKIPEPHDVWSFYLSSSVKP